MMKKSSFHFGTASSAGFLLTYEARCLNHMFVTDYIFGLDKHYYYPIQQQPNLGKLVDCSTILTRPYKTFATYNEIKSESSAVLESFRNPKLCEGQMVNYEMNIKVRESWYEIHFLDLSFHNSRKLFYVPSYVVQHEIYIIS